MKKKIIVFAVCLLAGLIGFQTGRLVEAGSASPGSQSDPLITKSYLDERLSSMGDPGASVSKGFTSTSLKKGETLTVPDGAQLIMYKGNASISAGSLINLTEGSLFKSGNSLVLYSLLFSAGETTIKASSAVTVYLAY
ncbi:MAG: hypothetical protein ILP10_01265 [Lachnospiraceae bacterium]|nr:hypothetical protein [Lachnospiraceae bacterium]